MAHYPLEIVEVRADDPAAIDAAFEIGNAALRADLPDLPENCRYQHDMSFVVPPPWVERRVFLALDGDVPAGTVQLDLPRFDNLDKAHVEVKVRPAHRRRGIGRALCRHAAGAARAAGRKSLLGFSASHPAPCGFAEAFGASNGLTDARRRLLLADLDEGAVDHLYADGLARSRGYAVVQWRNEPPESYIEDLAALDSSFLAETPMGELDYEPEKVDAERLRRQHDVYALWGSRRYQTGMIHEATGRLVAWTAMRVTKSVDWHGWQTITLVHPAHRGRRLGVVAKVANLRFLRTREPAVTTIDTFNAAENSYMIAINEAMGFRFSELWSNWQLPAPE
ncbi:GNAT family N-acetyltransferase [Dactylosporangium sp. NPDC051484]|uniref:GNAT family N-acetyltransferase n=1 Tax=Dactylosporangium sp. NPDC051484 TaxID=3154942 RepID=UPI00344D1EA5